MKFLIVYGESREELCCDEDSFSDDFKLKLMDLMDIDVDFYVQRYDAEWEEWINVKANEKLTDKLKLKCIMKEELPSTPVSSSLPACSPCVSDSDVDSLSSYMSSVSYPSSPLSRGTQRLPNIRQLEERMTVLLREALHNGTNLSWQLKHELLQVVCDSLYKVSKYPPREMRETMAQQLVSTYTQLKDRLGSGHHSWLQKFDNALKSMRGRDQSLTVRKRKLKSESVSLKVARRGEVNWNPELVEDATIISQHQDIMIREFGKVPEIRNVEKIKDLMTVSYAHRRDLVNSNIEIPKLKEQYPCLFLKEELTDEFSRLMDIDLDKVFLEKFPVIAVHLVDSQLKKKKTTKEVEDILSAFKKAKTGRDDTDIYMVAGMLLLPHILRENPEGFYTIVEKEMDSPDHAVQACEESTPKMVIVGNPITSNRVYLVGEGEMLLECNKIPEAACLLFSLYYACNVMYPKKTHCTYLFLQKCVFGVNDTEKVPAKVLTLASLVG